ncbi:MAG: hypothetical protein ACYS14_14645, partial [Planctomycetota bacterium]
MAKNATAKILIEEICNGEAISAIADTTGLRGSQGISMFCHVGRVVSFMKRYVRCVFVAMSLLVSLAATVRAEPWPCWRGPRGDGTCIEKNIPTNWDPSGAVWKTELPGKGHASPIVCSDRVFTVTALPERLERVLLCLDRDTGTILWQKTVVEGPLEK